MNSCAVGKVSWARFKETKSGVKIHLIIQYPVGEEDHLLMVRRIEISIYTVKMWSKG